MAEHIVAPVDLRSVLCRLVETTVNERIAALVDDLGIDPAGEEMLALRKAFTETVIDAAVAAVVEQSAVLIERGIDVRLTHDVGYPDDEDYDGDPDERWWP